MKTAIKWAIITALFIFGSIALIIVLGEENPDAKLSIFDFFVLKVTAVFALVGIYNITRYCYRKDLLPECVVKEIQEKG